MTIYIDEIAHHPSCRWANKHWCHIATDQDDLTELHELIISIGVSVKYFQHHPTMPHYDLYPSKRQLAIANGAVPVTSTELVKRCSKLFKNKIRITEPKLIRARKID